MYYSMGGRCLFYCIVFVPVCVCVWACQCVLGMVLWSILLAPTFACVMECRCTALNLGLCGYRCNVCGYTTSTGDDTVLYCHGRKNQDFEKSVTIKLEKCECTRWNVDLRIQYNKFSTRTEAQCYLYHTLATQMYLMVSVGV